MKKFFLKIHLWLSVPLGIVFFLLCITGSILVYEEELQHIFDSNKYYVEEVKDTPLPLSEIVLKANSQVDENIQLGGATIPMEKDENYAFSIEGMHKAKVYVDPYTGEVRGMTLPSSPNFFSYMQRLHRWLLIPMQRDSFNWGRFITGWTTLLSVFILITGIIIWIPKSWKYVKKRLTIKTKKGTFRFLYDLHVAGGMYSVIILLLLCLTGLTWSFPWYRTAFYKTFGVVIEQKAQSKKAPQGGSDKSKTASIPVDKYIVWQDVLNTLKEKNTNAESIRLSDGSASVVNPGKSFRFADKYTFDQKNGNILKSEIYNETATRRQEVMRWYLDIHFGTWAGWFSKLITFIAGLIGAALPVTGYYLWIKKKVLKAQGKKKRAKAKA